MNIEQDINILKQLIREYKRKPETQNEFFIGLIEERALENLLTAYEKEKEKNKELEKENKKLNILRLELLISQFPDTTETYKKYKKELDELLKEE